LLVSKQDIIYYLWFVDNGGVAGDCKPTYANGMCIMVMISNGRRRVDVAARADWFAAI
jgi:hypothetical protein